MNKKEIIKLIILPIYNKRMPEKSLSTAFFTRIKIKNKIIKNILCLKPITQILYAFPITRKIFFVFSASERVVEIPFVLENINSQENSKILDFGCARSPLPLYLANKGYKVIGSDLRDYNLKHPNFKFIKGDFMKIDFSKQYFDVIISVSVLEHVGLEKYGSNKFERGDIKVMKKFKQLLTKNGKLIITVPYGKEEFSYMMRIYNRDSLKRLLKGYKIEKEEYYYRKNYSDWVKVKPSFLNNKSSIKEVIGVAMICAKKK